jgi:hypothetical protein
MYSGPNVKLNLRAKCITVTAKTIRENIGLGYKLLISGSFRYIGGDSYTSNCLA